MTPELEQQRDKLLAILQDCGRVAVAFSGGVDSAVVAKAAALACGDNATAYLADSASLASGEKYAAQKVAASIGIEFKILETTEFLNDSYRANAPNRCFFCKDTLYTTLENDLQADSYDTIVNGANLDDQSDHRPGMVAAKDHQVRSPLLEAGLRKSDVRSLAKYWNLDVWDKPATPCLSSRIAYGLEVTEERVSRVDQAEKFLREEFNIRELRVRHEQNDLARIEVPLGRLSDLLVESNRELIIQKMKSLGFKFVTFDMEGFRSGSMNAVVELENFAPKNPSPWGSKKNAE